MNERCLQILLEADDSYMSLTHSLAMPVGVSAPAWRAALCPPVLSPLPASLGHPQPSKAEALGEGHTAGPRGAWVQRKASVQAAPGLS